jgi:hypothetical protein
VVETGESEDVGLVSDPIVMVQAFAELKYGVEVVHMRENSVKYGYNL